MKKNTYISALLVLLLLMVQNVAFAQTATVKAFSDVSASHKNYRAITFLKADGMIAGYPDGTFGPSKTINRAEFVAILVKSLPFVGADAGEPSDSDKNCFPDVKEEWFAKPVCFAQKNGWVKGYPNGTFGPEKAVNLAESLQIIAKVYEFNGFDSLPIDTRLASSVKGQWYSSALSFASTTGILEPSPAQVDPNENMTRARAAEHFYRASLIARMNEGFDTSIWKGTDGKDFTFADYYLVPNTKEYSKARVMGETTRYTEDIHSLSKEACKAGSAASLCLLKTTSEDTSTTLDEFKIVNDSVHLLKTTEHPTEGSDKTYAYEIPEALPRRNMTSYFKLKTPVEIPTGTEILKVQDGIQTYMSHGATTVELLNLGVRNVVKVETAGSARIQADSLNGAEAYLLTHSMLYFEKGVGLVKQVTDIYLFAPGSEPVLVTSQEYELQKVLD